MDVATRDISLSSQAIADYFKFLPCVERIELLCNLLRMLSPQEVRFVAVCVEDLARNNHTYNQFRALEQKANDSQFIREACKNLRERDTRAFLTSCIAVLTSDNANSAAEIFR